MKQQIPKIANPMKRIACIWKSPPSLGVATALNENIEKAIPQVSRVAVAQRQSECVHCLRGLTHVAEHARVLEMGPWASYAF
jgi:hypothetical protein